MRAPSSLLALCLGLALVGCPDRRQADPAGPTADPAGTPAAVAGSPAGPAVDPAAPASQRLPTATGLPTNNAVRALQRNMADAERKGEQHLQQADEASTAR